MSIAKSVARKIIFPFLVSSKVVKLLMFNEKNRTLIVMYHGVVPNVNFKYSANHLSVESFEQQIKYIKNNFNVLKLKDAFSAYRAGDRPQEFSIVITFDDGYENNFKYAYPVLMKYNVPATIFTVTAHLDDPMFVLWYDIIDFSRNVIPLSDFVEKINLMKGKEFAEKIKTWNDLKNMLKTFSKAEKEIVLKIEESLLNKILSDVPEAYYKLLNRQQMKTMSDSGLIEIGSHTHSHPNLDVIRTEDARVELESSNLKLENITSQKTEAVAFPDGAYSIDIKEMALQVGYKNLLAVDYKLNVDQNDKSILPRYCVSNTTTAESNIVQMYNAFKKKGF